MKMPIRFLLFGLYHAFDPLRLYHTLCGMRVYAYQPTDDALTCLQCLVGWDAVVRRQRNV